VGKEFQDEVLRFLWELRRDLRQILHALHLERIERFVITRQGETSMGFPLITPGSSAVYTATPVPATAVPSTPPTWVSSDPVNAPVSADPTGLIGTVNPPALAVPTTFTLTVTYTNADGSVATGSVTDQVVAVPPPPSPDITAFNVTRTA
jgi:hypothetical protein